MKIDVTHLAKLARLTIDEEERPRFAAEMQGIVEMVEKLPPIEGKLTADPANRMTLRPDRVEPSMRREALLENAPQSEAGCIVVPRVVE